MVCKYFLSACSLFVKVWLNLKVEVSQSCPTLCDPVDCSPPGILQTRILEWVASPFCRVSSWPRDWMRFSCVAGKPFTIWTTRVGCLLILITGSFSEHIYIFKFWLTSFYKFFILWIVFLMSSLRSLCLAIDPRSFFSCLNSLWFYL